MEGIWQQLLGWFTGEHLAQLMRALVVLVVGTVLARLLAAGAGRLARRYTENKNPWLARRLVFYGVMALVLVTVLQQLGFQLGVLLGAAGILTVALGFASQTSASNLISGLFLIGERSFQVGDLIRVGETTLGEVMSIDLLSVKLRTRDNLFVRVPNESLIKSEITNLTRFPVRRLDLQLGVAYKESIPRVREVLTAVADANPLCLTEPRPEFIFTGFGDSAQQFQFSVWVQKENFLQLKNAINEEIKAAFDAEGIEIPFPHRTLHTNGSGEPLPIRIVGDSTGSP